MNNIHDADSKFLLHAKLKRFPRKLMARLFLRALRSKIFTLTYFWDEDQRAELEFVRALFRDYPISMSLAEAYQIYQTARAISDKVEGDIAEVGVYRGGTAKVICAAGRSGKHLHLFDTFGEGLPEPGGKDDAQWKKGSFKLPEIEFDAIKRRLADEPNVHFHQGVFPRTASPVKEKRFSFVHLDADIYQSTFDALNFFYPRMSRGGVIISHDYHGAAGVKTAFDEFFADKPEVVLSLSTSQCLVTKL